jgi:hypothetical protein
MTKVFDFDELEKKLIDSGIDRNLICKMFYIYDWFHFQKGFQQELYFDDDSYKSLDLHLERLSQKDEIGYYEEELSSLLVEKLHIDVNVANQFIDVENQYLEEMGVVQTIFKVKK